jgi:hypothetical protein
MIKFDITVDSDLLQQLAYRMPSLFGEKVAPATSGAFNMSAKYIQGTWKGWAMGGPIMGIPNIKAPSSSLAASIRIRKNAPFDVNIETESTYAKRIEEGTPELDMKTTHPFGHKSRVAKSGPNKGVPYLIVPFRWGTPNQAGGRRAHFSNVIPQNLYSIIRAFDMKKSRRLEVRGDGSKAIHVEENYRGEPIERSEYEWGERIETDGNANGMVRMANDTKRGGSTYFTFRIISAASPQGSWIRKAVEPVDVVSALEKATRPAVEGLIQSGLEADLGI